MKRKGWMQGATTRMRAFYPTARRWEVVSVSSYRTGTCENPGVCVRIYRTQDGIDEWNEAKRTIRLVEQYWVPTRMLASTVAMTAQMEGVVRA